VRTELEVKTFYLESSALRDNPLGDPYVRRVEVIEPESPKGRPLLIYLSGYLSSALSQLNYDPLSEDMLTKAKRLKAEGKIQGSVIVLPDTFTRVGGNQYINSPAVGNYEDFILKELIPYFAERYGTDRVGVIGKSSGGYGALVLGMKSDAIKAIASHSGDAYFEYVYLPLFPKVIPHLRKFKGPKEWLDYFWAKANRKRREDLNVLNVVGMSAFYSPTPSGDIELPFDLETGEILEGVWRKWLEKDPVRLVDSHYERLRRKFVYLDVGTKDEFNIQYGFRILHRKLKEHKVDHVYEEYEDGHFNTSYRYDISISLLESYLRNDQ